MSTQKLRRTFFATTAVATTPPTTTVKPMAILIMGRTGFFLLSLSTKFSYYKMCVLWHCCHSGWKITAKISYFEFSRQLLLSFHGKGKTLQFKLSLIWILTLNSHITKKKSKTLRSVGPSALPRSILDKNETLGMFFNHCVCYRSVGHLGKWLLQYSSSASKKGGKLFNIIFFFIPTGINQKGCYKAKKSFQLVSHFQFVLL